MSPTTTEGCFKALSFGQETKLEQWRAATALTKEPGTIAWLDELHEGDVFYDIGANIGIYTLYAAERVGPTGHVYAVEPHLANAASLLKNIAANGLTERVTVACVALSFASGWDHFQYRDVSAGASGSQIHQPIGEDGHPFQPVVREWKRTETLEHLSWAWRKPTAIKIDVDGHEFGILDGAAGVGPQSWQVEVHPQDAGRIARWFSSAGYPRSETHYTSHGQKQIDKGADPATVTANVIYRRQA